LADCLLSKARHFGHVSREDFEMNSVDRRKIEAWALEAGEQAELFEKLGPEFERLAKDARERESAFYAALPDL
jgi:hypothetical protein